MKITRQDVMHIAKLARLKINEDEYDRLMSDMGNIIDFADMLNEIDTDNVEPTYHAVSLHNVFREDVVTNNYDRDKLLENAPGKHDGCFEVPTVVE